MKLPPIVLFPLGHLGLSHTNTKCPLFLLIEIIIKKGWLPALKPKNYFIQEAD
jgi:hypothetical protein